MSGRFVPASTTTPCVVAKPSISTSSWFSVFSRSSLPPAKPPRPRALPMASISSAKKGLLFSAAEHYVRDHEQNGIGRGPSTLTKLTATQLLRQHAAAAKTHSRNEGSIKVARSAPMKMMDGL